MAARKREPNWAALQDIAGQRATVIALAAKAKSKRMRAESDEYSIILAGGDPAKARGRERAKLLAAGRAMRAKTKRDKQAHVKRLHHVRLRQAMPPWADIGAIQAIYDEARRLTAETGIPHEVDHIEPLLGQNASGLHWHGNLRVITRTENRRKGNRRA